MSFDPLTERWSVLLDAEGCYSAVPEGIDLRAGERIVREGLPTLSVAERVAAKLARQANPTEEES